METFTIEDLRNAFEVGQRQKSAEWENDTTSSIGYYNSYADMDFDSWFNENLKNK
jgi:hypothetical protein